MKLKNGSPQYVIAAAEELVKLDKDLESLSEEAKEIKANQRKIRAIVKDYVVEDAPENTAT